MPAKLTVCYSDQPAVETYLFEDSLYQIGRSQDCDVCLLHPSVSRKHAQVAYPEQAWVLSDVQSRNGTRVNGLKVTRSTLMEDAIISVGELDCLFETKSRDQIQAMVAHDAWRKDQSLLTQPVAVHLTQSLLMQLQNVLSLTGTQRGVVLLGERLDTLTLAACLGFHANDFRVSEFEGSVGAISHCLEQGRQIVAMDTAKEHLLKHRKSIELKQISSLACIPLKFKNTLIGVLYTDSKIADKLLTELDLDILSNIGDQVAATMQSLLVQQTLDSIQKFGGMNFNGQAENEQSHFLTLCH